MNIEKLKACIVHACGKAANQLDPIRLNKVLWYSDAAAYMENGASITGTRYVRKPRGPVASAMSFAIRQLAEARTITLGHRFDAEHGSWVDEYIVNDESIAESLSSDEISYVDHAIKRVCMDHTAAEISERTHGEIWELAADGEEIPLYTMFAERLAPITKEHITAFAV